MSGSAAPAHQERPHIPALDGVRGLAALLVVFFHFGRAEIDGVGAHVVGSAAQFGWGGVDLFFVLSGFLIGGILLDTRHRPGFLRTFYTRRTLRIFPLYFFFVAVFGLVIAPAMRTDVPLDLSARQWWLWTYLSNIDIARHGWYAGAGAMANGLWSLAIEEQFYLVAPFAVLLLSRRALTIAALTCIVGAIVGRFVLADVGYPSRVGYVLTFTRVDALSLGILIALAARHGNLLARLTPAARWVLVGCGVYIFGHTRIRGAFAYTDWNTLQFALPALTLACGALIVLTVSPVGSPLLRRAFESRALRFLGVYSYSLYIWHPLVGSMVRLAGFDQARILEATGSSTAAILLTLIGKTLAAVVVAVISYYIVELPFLKLKDRRPSRAAYELSIAPPRTTAPTDA